MERLPRQVQLHEVPIYIGLKRLAYRSYILRHPRPDGGLGRPHRSSQTSVHALRLEFRQV